jgi:hypothetical protein
LFGEPGSVAIAKRLAQLIKKRPDNINKSFFMMTPIP